MIMKRLLDLLLAALALLLLSLPLLVLVWLVRRKLGSPVFFARHVLGCMVSLSP